MQFSEWQRPKKVTAPVYHAGRVAGTKAQAVAVEEVAPHQFNARADEPKGAGDDNEPEKSNMGRNSGVRHDCDRDGDEGHVDEKVGEPEPMDDQRKSDGDRSDGVNDTDTSLFMDQASVKDVGNSAPFAVTPAVGNSADKSVGNSTVKPVGKPVGKSRISQRNQQPTRTVWFRNEIDFRKTKKGYWVLIRKRLKWSNTRYSKLVTKRFCPQMTTKMVEQIRVGKFSKEAQDALQFGGINYVIVNDLLTRLGKGNGKRKAELTDLERSLLARIESSVIANNRGGDSDT